MTSGTQALSRHHDPDGERATCWRCWPSPGTSCASPPGPGDEQARQRTTVSELTLGGLIKHVTAVERNWPASSCTARPSPGLQRHDRGRLPAVGRRFRLLPGETLAACSPSTPRWPSTPTSWSHAARPRRRPRAAAARGTRRVSAGPRARTAAHRDRGAQHAGHADIIRESWTRQVHGLTADRRHASCSGCSGRRRGAGRRSHAPFG